MTIKNFDGIVSCVSDNDDDDDFIDEIMEHDIPYISSSSDHQDEENMKITHNQDQENNNNSPRTIQTQTRTQECCTITINSIVCILCYIVSLSAFCAFFILLLIIIIGPHRSQVGCFLFSNNNNNKTRTQPPYC